MRCMKGMCLTIEIMANESVHPYVTALRKPAKTCNYGALTDLLIRHGMVVGINDNSACKKLLQTNKLTLRQNGGQALQREQSG